MNPFFFDFSRWDEIFSAANFTYGPVYGRGRLGRGLAASGLVACGNVGAVFGGSWVCGPGQGMLGGLWCFCAMAPYGRGGHFLFFRDFLLVLAKF